jgi:hypothetical protein
LGSWDNWLPLAVITVFAGLGLLVALRVITFPSPRQAERILTIYIEVGIGATAGIFAIIASLSLVAIQFASQEYSHRIMAFYIKSIMFWSTIAVYLGLIITSVLLIGMFTDKQDPRYAGAIIVGSVGALTLLIPHFLITSAFLRPEFIIAKLLRRVDTPYLVSVQRALAEDQGRLDSHVDRLLPVVEIVERAIHRGDLSTARTALDRLHTTYVTHAEHLNSLPIEEHFLNYLLRIGRKAVTADGLEEAAAHSVQIIGAVGSRGPAGANAVDDIRELGFAALKQDLEPVVREMIDTLRFIFDRTSLPEAKAAVLSCYQDLVEDLAAGEKTRLLRQSATNLAELAATTLEQRETAYTHRCQELLEAVGREASSRRMHDVALHVIGLLQRFGVAAAQHDPEVSERVVRSLLRIERSAGSGDRDLVAATEFAKGDVERELRKRGRVAESLASAAPVAAPSDPPAPPPSVEPEVAEDSAFADLWREPKN